MKFEASNERSNKKLKAFIFIISFKQTHRTASRPATKRGVSSITLVQEAKAKNGMIQGKQEEYYPKKKTEIDITKTAFDEF